MSRYKRSRRSLYRRYAFFAVMVILLCISLSSVYIYAKLSKIGHANPVKNIKVNALDDSTKMALNGYTNFALFGVDNRSSGNYENGNSDVIMLVSIDNDTKKIRITSIYRDTFLKVGDRTDGSGSLFRKCNYAYNHGGVYSALSMLNQKRLLHLVKSQISQDSVTAMQSITAGWKMNKI